MAIDLGVGVCEVFTVRGQEFSVPVLDTLEELRRIADDLPDTALHRDYLSRVVEYVQETHGVGLSIGEADLFIDELERLQVTAKKKRADAIRAMLR